MKVVTKGVYCNINSYTDDCIIYNEVENMENINALQPDLRTIDGQKSIRSK